MVSYGLRSTKPRNFRPKTPSTRLHASPKYSAVLPSVSHAYTRRQEQPGAHTCHTCHTCRICPTCPQRCDVMDDVILCWPVCPDLTWTNPEIWPGPNRLKKKKKKKRENALTKRTFDLDQKVKIFKTDLSHSIFRVHSDFGTRFFIRSSEIVQTSNFQKSWLLCKCWPNVKIFKMNLSCSIFRVHSDFGVRSVIWDSEIAKMTQFQVFKT